MAACTPHTSGSGCMVQAMRIGPLKLLRGMPPLNFNRVPRDSARRPVRQTMFTHTRTHTHTHTHTYNHAPPPPIPPPSPPHTQYAHRTQSGDPAIAAGFDHTCAIVAGGSIKCWGRNDYGQLGIGSAAQQNSPVDVSLGPGGRVRYWRKRAQAGDGAPKESCGALRSCQVF